MRRLKLCVLLPILLCCNFAFAKYLWSASIDPTRVIMVAQSELTNGRPQSSFARFEDGDFVSSIGAPWVAKLALLDNRIVTADFDTLYHYDLGGSLKSTESFRTFNPSSLESDNAGNLYITNPRNAGAARLASDGTITTFSHPNLRNVAGIDADADGNVYVVQSGIFNGIDQQVLFKFDAAGNFQSTLTLQTENAGDLAIDEERGVIYVSDEFSSLGVKTIRITPNGLTQSGGFFSGTDANIAGIYFDSERDTLLAVDFGIRSTRGSVFEYATVFDPAIPRNGLMRPVRPGTLLATYPLTGNADFILGRDVVAFTIPEPNTVAMTITAILLLGTFRIYGSSRIRKLRKSIGEPSDSKHR